MAVSKIAGVGRGLKALFAFAMGDDKTVAECLRDDDAPPGDVVAGDATKCRATRGCSRGPDHKGACVLPASRPTR